MPAKVTKFGPGTISVGETGAPVDFSAQLINGLIEWDKDKDDDVTVLSGDIVAGASTYTATLSGTLFQDLAASGILEFSWTHKGEQVPFTFTPNTANGTSVEGDLVIDPVPFGSDEPKANMQGDFTWNLVGEPTLTIGTPVGMSASEPEAEPVA